MKIQSKLAIVMACVLGILTVSAGCNTSKISDLGRDGVDSKDGYHVPFSRRGLSLAEQRAALLSPTHVATKKQFELIWGDAERGWVAVDSPMSSKLQLEFKLYNCLFGIINRASKRASLIKDLRSKISVIAQSCPDDQVIILTGVSEFISEIERAIMAGGLHSEDNFRMLGAYIQLKRDNASSAYSLRWNPAGRRFSQVVIS